jgi:geranyl-CoA carboxylase alpha subunit
MSQAFKRFGRVLIANRGEIVTRVARSAHAMGLQTVAVYSHADRLSPHLHSCDTAVCIGGDHAKDSYLSVPKLLQAAKNSGADAVHPGYGFLSENADFAQAVTEAGLVWIGPPACAMRAMADKAQARQHMQNAGVPVLPGSLDASTDMAALLQEAHTLGFPLMVKASAGGGGRGMRLVLQASELPAALESAMQEAQAAFGDGRLLLERALLKPRHVEVQLLADAHGHVVHLGERDCTVQRRHQKLIEEAPSPAVDSALRRQLGDAAVAVARAVGYQGAGTVEFLLDARPLPQPAFYFMEMNTRLQVEHPVTEALVNEDLVQWQLRLAMGEPLSLQQDSVLERFEQGGHAIEARLCAEDPMQQHMPQSGTLLYWQAPGGLRCDAALVSGQTIGSFYDSMLGKLIAHAPTREQAALALADGLERTVCLGVANNSGFLAQVLRSDVFLQGEFNTSVLRTDLKHLPAPHHSSSLHAIAALVVACVPRHAHATPLAAWWNWHSSGHVAMQVPLRIGGQLQHWQVHMQQHVWRVSQGNEIVELSDLQLLPVLPAANGIDPFAMAKGQLQLTLDHQPLQLFYAWAGDELWLQLGGDSWMVEDARLQPQVQSAAASSNQVHAPMHGRVLRLEVVAGDAVTSGQLLLVMEAMKMEHHLHAPRDGTVQGVHASAGMQVSRGQKLVQLTP